MNKILRTTLTGIFALTMPAFASAADLTEPAPKAVLVEDYTGIHCSQCPQGHSVVAGMLQEHPDQVVAVGIHAGSFAVPGTNQPDFRLDEGEAYCTRFNITSFPTAMVNRAPYSNIVALGRNVWVNATRTQAAMTADVNLQIDKAEFDVNTRVLKVKVSGCFTADPPADPLITLWLTQSGILGPQTGGNKGDNYLHNHVLRVVLTDKWGDALPEITKGQVFTFEKEYTLPEAVKNIPLTPGELELVAFVAQSKRELLNVTKAHLTYPGYSPEPEVRLQASLEAVPNRYGWKFVDIRLTNLTNQTITTAQFDVAENRDSKDETVNPADAYNWTGEIAPSETAVIRIPLKVETDHTMYAITALKVNGNDVASNTVEGSFRVVTVESPVQPVLEFSAMASTQSLTWNILDDQGNMVQSFGPYPSTTKTYKETLNPLEKGKVYCVEVRDSWGGYVAQGARLLGDSGNQLLEILGGYVPAARGFFRVAGNVSLEDIDVVTEDAPAMYYDLTGRRVLNPASGQLLIRVKGSKAEKILMP